MKRRMRNSDLLVTGATGFVGSQLVRSLLAARPESRIHCLIRARDPAYLERRRARLLEIAGVSAADAPRVIAQAGTLETLELPAGVGEVFHLAAKTSFDVDFDEARRINCEGTARVIDAARRRGARLHHVSTAYVVGDPDTGAFRNAYEQSKAEADALVLGAAAEIPVTCYRPSIVVGDSRNGHTLHFRVLYEPMKWVYLGKATVLPCRPEVRLDVVPVDWVCAAIVELSSRDDTRGRALPLSAGAERALSIAEIVDISVETANRYHAEIGEPPIEAPRIVTPDTRTSETESLFAAGEAVMRTHLPYMLREQLFDPGETLALLPAGARCPALRDYMARIVRYGLERRFGSA